MPKMPKSEKIIGYALLTLGVILLLFSIYEMFNVFYGNAAPPKLFDIGDVSLSVGGVGTASIISGAQISQLPNLFCWFVLMGFLLLAGGKIASLGVNMIKEIQVEISEPMSAPTETKSA
jgi:hypothetical protein